MSEGLLSSSFLRVSSRISRASFGLQFQEPFDRRRHHKDDQFYDLKEGSFKARRQMRWFLIRVSIRGIIKEAGSVRTNEACL